MKVLLVGPNSVHVTSFVRALNDQGVIPDILLEQDISIDGVGERHVMSFRGLKPTNVLSKVRELKRLLKEISPDLIHIHQVNRVAYFVSRAAFKLRIPVITTAWGSDVLVIPQANKFYRYLVHKTLERSSIVTADSKEMIAAMNSVYVGGEKYRLLQYGVDLIPSLPKEKIIYSNRLHEKLYRIEQIIDYAEDFFQSHPDWQLVIGATGSETITLMKLVEQKNLNDKITFVGWLEKSDNQNWYARASIYISIPKHDGTAVSLLEAMSAGCIPVVSNLEVSKEWISDGENGVIEKQGVNPLEEALKIDQQDCADINGKLIETKAGRESCTKTYLEYYHELVNE